MGIRVSHHLEIVESIFTVYNLMRRSFRWIWGASFVASGLTEVATVPIDVCKVLINVHSGLRLTVYLVDFLSTSVTPARFVTN